MSNQITVGRVSQRKRACLHYNIDGRADCGAGGGQIIPASIRELTSDDAPRVCRRSCRAKLLAAAKEAQITANMRAGHSTTPNGAYHAHVARLLVEALESPADRLNRQRSDEAFRAQFDAIVAASLQLTAA